MLTVLKAQHLRNLAPLHLSFEPGLHFFCGPNGSGKSSMLEAVYLLSAGRSFRATSLDQLITEGQDSFIISASNHSFISAGLEKQKNNRLKTQLERRPVPLSEFASFLPALIMNTESLNLLNQGPSLRRQLIDWGTFHVEPTFKAAWQAYVRALKQRNATLKAKLPPQDCFAWNTEIAKWGENLHQLRLRFLDRFLSATFEGLMDLLPIQGVCFNFLMGWPEKHSLLEMLEARYYEDLRLGYTLFGPHRADLEIKMRSTLARERLSRGQQKMLVCALNIGLARLLQHAHGKSTCFLLDDLPAELDFSARTRLLDLLREQRAQVFVTGIDFEAFQASFRPKQDALFHVEQGKITRST